MVSRHTLAELPRKPDAPYELAKTVEVPQYWPIGTIAEQVATIEQLGCTWEDARRNQQIQEELEQLAKSGSDIRDRGAYIDALRAVADAFVTSDRQLVGSGPGKRIEDRFRLRVLTPCNLVSKTGLYFRLCGDFRSKISPDVGSGVRGAAIGCQRLQIDVAPNRQQLGLADLWTR